jgi:nucleoside-diphosphate kinase
LVKYITSTPIVALVIEGSDAVEGSRATIGATHPIKATPGTIRGDYGQTIGRNLVHGSDSPASAEREIAIWFEPHEIFSRPSEIDSWIVSN